MLTNTLILYVTQEAWAKARERLVAGRPPVDHHDEHVVPRWLEAAERRLKSAADLRRRQQRTRH